MGVSAVARNAVARRRLRGERHAGAQGTLRRGLDDRAVTGRIRKGNPQLHYIHAGVAGGTEDGETGVDVGVAGRQVGDERLALGGGEFGEGLIDAVHIKEELGMGIEELGIRSWP